MVVFASLFFISCQQLKPSMNGSQANSGGSNTPSSQPIGLQAISIANSAQNILSPNSTYTYTITNNSDDNYIINNVSISSSVNDNSFSISQDNCSASTETGVSLLAPGSTCVISMIYSSSPQNQNQNISAVFKLNATDNLTQNTQDFTDNSVNGSTSSSFYLKMTPKSDLGFHDHKTKDADTAYYGETITVIITNNNPMGAFQVSSFTVNDKINFIPKESSTCSNGFVLTQGQSCNLVYLFQPKLPSAVLNSFPFFISVDGALLSSKSFKEKKLEKNLKVSSKVMNGSYSISACPDPRSNDMNELTVNQSNNIFGWLLAGGAGSITNISKLSFSSVGLSSIPLCVYSDGNGGSYVLSNTI